MSNALLALDRPATVLDEPAVEVKLNERSIRALWPLRQISDRLDGNGTEYAVLSVYHSATRRCYYGTINREEHFAQTRRHAPLDATRVTNPIPAARHSAKALQAAFDAFLHQLRDSIQVGGDQQLAAYFTPAPTTEG